MLSQKQIGILGTGAYVPTAVLTNQDLEKLVAERGAPASTLTDIQAG